MLTAMSNIASGNAVAEIAALIGDAARANIVLALMDGRALTAGELAWHAGVSAQTASGHLAKLAEARLLAMEKQGRHRYFRIATPDVAQAMEALMALAAAGPKRYRPAGPRDLALRQARTCYDHIAGRLGVALAETLCAGGFVVLADGAAEVTAAGVGHFHDLGIGVSGPAARPLCRTCLDWSERRPHLAGRLGAALLDHALGQGWVVRAKEGRALVVTRAGERGLVAGFGLPPDWMGRAGE
jgi:DNA-binding transcriptional ArsR family regulator